MSEKKLKITETVLRDAHQSLIATRMRTEDMIPILEKMDQVGYHSIECWGGATFDACLRFLDEDPWDRLRTLRARIKNTRLQMLLRGQNLLGYRHYADDVVEYFVQKSVAGGIDILRIFDAFNDLRNLETAVRAAKKEGAEVQLAMAYTIGEAYTPDYWTKLAADMESMGADSICVKDMAGILVPEAASRLITALKDTVKIPLQLHSHCTSGVAPITYVKGVEAGCDVIDTAMSPFAMGTSQPATEVMVETFAGTPFDTGLDQTLLAEIADYFRPQRDRAIATGLMDPKVLGVDVKTLLYQVPGGMLSNLVSQLKDQNASDRFYEVLAEIPRVRKDLGEPPLVTPSSQIVGTQAVLNVLMGERYKVMSQETKAILHGDYGRTVKSFDPQVDVYKRQLMSYLNDMSKYNHLNEIKKTRLAYNNITVQLSKKNTRFQYKLIKKGGRAAEFENAIEWLCLSGIVSQVYRAEQIKKPLENYRDIDAFKIYVSDLGLLCAKKELTPSDILYMGEELNDFKGGMTENYVNVQLTLNGYTTYYWESPRGAEIDFVIQREGQLIPIEVKSADNTKAKSLNVYMQTFHPAYAIKLSSKNFGFEDGKKTVPLYAAFCI